MNKKQKNEIQADFEKMLEGFEVKPDETAFPQYGFTIETKYGKYQFTKPDLEGLLTSIHGRFAEPERAFKQMDCNPYNGKYNFHYTNDNGRELLKQFESFLKDVTIEKEEPAIEYTIPIEWSASDVLKRAKELEKDISFQTACNILDKMKAEHDAEMGINWDTIDNYLMELE